MIVRLFRRPWIFVTLLVIIAAAVMVRLGIWQLDRLAGRRAFNQQVLSQIDQPPLALTKDVISGDLDALEFRSVQVNGEFDLDNALVLGNQVWDEQIGVHLLTPLKIAGTDSHILVDRGWIPFEEWENRNLRAYNLKGDVSVEGMLRVSQTKLGLRDCLDDSAGEPPFQVWCLALDGIASYLPYDLLSVYLIQAPVGEQSAAPYQALPQIEITEGPHLGYAVQWFTFAGVLLIGYPFFVRREMQARQRKTEIEADPGADDQYHGWAAHLDEQQKSIYKMDDDEKR
jgi:surfeit locus 1 family protein